MNKMPEIAKMLGVEYAPKKPDFEVCVEGEWFKGRVGRWGIGILKSWGPYREDWDCTNTNLVLAGDYPIRKLPKVKVEVNKCE